MFAGSAWKDFPLGLLLVPLLAGFLAALHAAFFNCEVTAWKEAARAGTALAPREPRGVVIVGGHSHHGNRKGVWYTLDALLAIATLRRSGCKLPVELWHDGDEALAGTDTAGIQESLSVAGVVTFRNLHGTEEGRRLKGWELCTYAVKSSSFEEILYLDADNYVLADPSALFAEPLYQEAKSLFWPDTYTVATRIPLWSIVNHTPQLALASETGQLLVNRTAHHDSLAVAHHFNSNGWRYHWMTYGDNDLWRFGWLATGKVFRQSVHMPDEVGYLSEVDASTFCGTARVQKHPRTGEPMFLHLSTFKLSEHTGSAFPDPAKLHLQSPPEFVPGPDQVDLRLFPSNEKCRCWKWACRSFPTPINRSVAAEEVLNKIVSLQRWLLELRDTMLLHDWQLQPEWWAKWSAIVHTEVATPRNS